MKRWYQAVMTAVLLMMALLPIHAADSQVIYQGGAEDFVLTLNHDPFMINASDLVPGQALQESFLVSNRSQQPIKLIVTCSAADNKLWDGLMMTITDDAQKVLFTSTSMSESVSLGLFQIDQEKTYHLQISLPTALTNDYQNQLTQFRIIFKAIEGTRDLPETGGKDLPNTGVQGINEQAIAVLIVAGLVILALNQYIDRKQH